MTLLVTNIKQLVGVREENVLLRGKELAQLPVIEDAYLLINDGVIAAYGEMKHLGEWANSMEQTFDARGQFVLPAWCDSHTHLVFAGSREEEFVDKIKGVSYEAIAAKGGGILNSAAKLAAMSELELLRLAWSRLEELISLGTGAIEIKSGYGLSVEAELKMLRVIQQLKETSPIPVVSTFLGAHTYPLAYRDDHKGYIDAIINEMLPVIADENLADFVDVFCEKGFFSVEEMEEICKAAMQYGLKPKLHVNQLHSIGGLQKAIELNAVSVDHLETMTNADIADLAQSNVIGTLLPSAAFFLRMPYQPARAIIDAGAAVALASDFNPGSSPSGNMNLVVSMSCIGMKMLPEEAINAATINGAFAMNLEQEVGSITVGKRANLIFTRSIPSLPYLPYAFGSNLIDRVMIGGEFFR
ncbi:imidazolonepropionase [Lacibacter luteus]|uniref:Imidazolonepropionase n=1 Tax=Lacibacter luteus TaxID=2508719 RepID=A0A4Q1CMB7_9BACT|nr:imidazolonepropionase [Lacibacter luteus]RXK62163.1 imidazolonepropionase [Lacibacter luteus]